MPQEIYKAMFLLHLFGLRLPLHVYKTEAFRWLAQRHTGCKAWKLNHFADAGLTRRVTAAAVELQANIFPAEMTLSVLCLPVPGPRASSMFGCWRNLEEIPDGFS